MKTSGFSGFIPGFQELLNRVDLKLVSPETYCRKYLGHLLQHQKYYLSIYSDILNKLVFHAGKQAASISLIDFGSGNGLLALFARFCGFKQVFINDIDQKFVAASGNLANQMNITIDGYITGDIWDVQLFFQNKMPDAIVGTDVIEHIYDLDDFFKTLKLINPFFVSVFTTASNPENYFKVRRLKKLQLRDEYEGGTPEDFILFGDKPLAPFLRIREDIIRSQSPAISEENIFKLAKATRGFNREDIILAINKYNAEAVFPVLMAHPTNTCNPVTSSWTERILPVEAYFALYESNGFKVVCYNGLYNIYKKGLKKIFTLFLNQAVRIFGISFAPYIIFAGSKK